MILSQLHESGKRLYMSIKNGEFVISSVSVLAAGEKCCTVVCIYKQRHPRTQENQRGLSVKIMSEALKQNKAKRNETCIF